MKVLITAGILLVCAYCVTSTALPRLKRKIEDLKMSDDEKEELVDFFNQIRRGMAKELEVSNMHRLKYDEDMESKVKDFGCKEEDVQKYLEEKAQNLKKGDADGLIKFLNEVGEDTPLGCFDPEKTTIACVGKKCENGKETGNCICGPSGKGDVKKGKAGSDCDDDDDGLCKKSASSNFFIFGTIVNMILFYLIASFF
ncbi:hypothetical protein GCK72_012139 [Caenorhabditis remanei]|uniref:Uncharacterized protein n=1 Tax=Caenorhabditis remanei TaxID=31234 RepID=A0A6A5GMX0_CAERE|nr:hypothetical protein GCK72_012139 [Caenorhabditis remanei]KAF1755689.1 hypothetical protein GCK72_012139 [Caenorhabditis remanei]